MKLKEQAKIIEIDVYKRNLHIIITNNIKKSYNKRLKQWKGGYEEVQPGGLYVTVDSHNYGVILLNPDTSNSTIAHECFHAVCNIMNFVGAHLDDGSEENYAYYLSYFVGICEDFIEETTQYFKEEK